MNNEINSENNSLLDNDICNMKYKILDLLAVIGNHKKEVEYVKELSNGFIISGGLDNNLIIYDNETFKKIFEIKDFKDWPYNIYEIINKEKDDKNLEIIVCCKKEIFFLLLDTEELTFNIYKKSLNNISINICLEMGKNTYIISGETGVYNLTNFMYNSERFNSKKISDTPFIGGIGINDNIIALTSNSIFPNGNDKLIFYNYNKKFFVSKKIENYSFVLSQNGIILMDLNEKNKILICACKKYSSGRNNGILLVNPQLEDYQEVIEPFYDTNEFEVYCFCQLYLSNKKSYNDYFLVGGFDSELGEGVIKLYKLIRSESVCNTKIEYIIDIVFEINEKFEGFERPITSIIQSKKNGNIIVSSWDGKIYLLTTPNLDFFCNNN